MRVKWKPLWTIETTEGIVVSTQVMNNRFYFLLLLDDGTFKEVKCEECIRISE